MSLFEVEDTPPRSERAPIPLSDIDMALTSQIVVAWAGETGEVPRRLGWWSSDLVSEFGGEDLFRRLLPGTWRWAALQSAREVARRKDDESRREADDADRIVSLFRLGFEMDERIDERLQDLKASGRAPTEALPGLKIIDDGWHPDRFWDWVAGHGSATTTTSRVGRRLAGSPPGALDQRVRKLVAALALAAEKYPLPHFRTA